MHTNKRQLNIIVFCALLLVSYANLRAQSYSFRNYSTSDGLSHTMINGIIQDRIGFVWIATSDGLNRYDGYTFKKYYTHKQDSLSLNDNNVNALLEDVSGKIWIATGSGFHYYTPETEAFRKVRFSNGDNTKLAEDLCLDDSGVVWGVENSNMLIRINADTDLQGQFIRLDSLLQIKTPIFNKKLLFAEGYIWIFSSVGIIRFDPQTMQAHLVHSAVSFVSPRIIRKGKPGTLFVVDWNEGVYQLNMQQLTLTPYMQKQILRATKNNMGITDVNYDDGGLWVLSYPGLCRISDSGTVEEFTTQSGYTKDYNNAIYFTSFRDKDGNLWLGTQDEGVVVVSPISNNFKHYSANTSRYNDLPATKFSINGDDIIICNSFGTFYRNKADTSPASIFTTLSNSVNVAISPYKNDQYLLFGKSSVSIFNKRDMSTQTIYETYSLQNGIVDSRGIIWMTHWEHGIEGYDPKTKKHYQIDVDTNDKSVNVVFCVVEDRDGSLWLGTFGSGLQHVHNPTSPNPAITKYTHSANKNSLNNNFVTSLFDDGNGALWIGTNGGGLHCLDKATQSLESYTTEDGLPSNVVQSIVADKDGNIWFATNIISKLDIHTKTFTHYDKSDGVNSKYFTLHAEASSDGILYFGDDKGILYFSPDDMKGKAIASPPIFTSVRLMGQQIEPRETLQDHVPFTRSITYLDTIFLPYYLNSISLEFATIQCGNSANINYSYKLNEMGHQWVQASSAERFATYAGLPSGEYTFMVRASNEQSVWGEARSIHIIITPPWWETLLFRFFIGFIFIGIVIIYIFNLMRRNQRLEQIVQKRTLQLRDANNILREERLVVEMKNEHLNDVLESKEKLMNIIAHDFKNPLNGILGISELLLVESQKIRHNKIIKYINIITSSANSLVTQMVDLIDWTLSEDDSLQAKPIEINAEVLVSDAINLVQSTANHKSISIELHNSSTKNAVIDPRMGSMIFRNLLSNAIKFTPTGGSITVLIKEMEATVDICFVDTGVGIDQSIIDRLLAHDDSVLSELGTDNEMGTGFGLRMTKKFVEKNNGILSITSIQGQGSGFTVSVPKGTKEITKISIKKYPHSQKEENLASDNAEKYTILVVDDDEDVRATICACLESQYRIVLAQNAQEGLDATFQLLPDIIISDIAMLGMSGIEMCEHIKKNKKTFHIPILLISSLTNQDVKDRAFTAGANDYIEKPFNTFHLMKKVQSMLLLKQKMNERTRNEIAQEVFPDIPNSYESDILKRINKFVEDNISNEKLNTNSVATELGISRAQLWRIYKKETGYSLGDYIKEQKIQKASAMLLTAKYRISDIAYELGFTDARYFSKWFMKERGMTPTQFIEKMESGK